MQGEKKNREMTPMTHFETLTQGDRRCLATRSKVHHDEIRGASVDLTLIVVGSVLTLAIRSRLCCCWI